MTMRFRSISALTHVGSAFVGFLALAGCEENHITNEYYTHADAGLGQSSETSSADAGPTSSTADSETSESSEPGESSEPSSSEAPPATTDDPETQTEVPVEAGTTSDETEGESSSSTGEDAAAPAPVNPFLEGAPTANADVAGFEIDVFGDIGNRYWFAADPDQVQLMNEASEEIYVPGGNSKPHVESLFVTTPGVDGVTADFGQLDVHIVGQSTRRPWSATTLPNLRLDMDYFTKDMRLGGYEHLRLNNGLVGTIFREKLTLDLYRKLGYPAPHTQFAWVGSNVWGPDVWIPYTMVEVYKKSFCAEYADQWGGGCESMWEYAGDFGYGVFNDPASCQSDVCDNTRAMELDDLVTTTPQGEGYKAALADYIDWDSYHQFQCLSWVLAVGDDAIHGGNNTVIVERSDGKFQMLPYSTDISLGQSWYSQVQLPGGTMLAQGCQSDPECWADTVAACDGLVQAFTELDPTALLDETYTALDAEGMLRPGDEGFHEELQNWFADRLVALPEELDANREGPQLCAPWEVWCDGYCTEPQYCFQCQVQDAPPRVAPIDGPVEEIVIAPEPGPEPLPVDGDGGVVPVGDGGEVIVEPPPNNCVPMADVVYAIAP